MTLKLISARVGHIFNDKKQFVGMFAQAAGDEIEVPSATMSMDDARRCIDRGLAVEVKKSTK